MARIRQSLISLLAVIVLSFTASCSTVTNPATGETEYTAVSQSQERQLGQQEHPKVLAEFGGAYDDPRLQAYVEDLGRRLVAVSELPEEQFTFTLLDSPVVNAFALPGGYVYITRGLISVMNSEAELAGVMGHEIGHVTAHHGARRQTQGLFAGILTMGAAILTGSQTVAQLGQLAAQGYLASYSRDNEREADQLGVRYLARTGYTPYGMAESLKAIGRHSELLAQMSGQEAQSVSFFSTHPQTPERITNTEQLAAEAGAPPNAPAHRDRFLEAVHGMVYGDSPAQGYARGNRFVHPQIRFRFEVPQSFKLDNLPQAIIASGPQNSRIIFDQESNREVARANNDMARYISEVWAKNARGGNLQRTTINGMPAATATVLLQGQGGEAYEGRIAAIRFGEDRIFRFVMAAPSGAAGSLEDDFTRTIQSFQRISEAEAAKVNPLTLIVVEVRPGDTVERLAASAHIDDFDAARFRVINGMAPGEEVQPGQKVKVIVE